MEELWVQLASVGELSWESHTLYFLNQAASGPKLLHSHVRVGKAHCEHLYLPNMLRKRLLGPEVNFFRLMDDAETLCRVVTSNLSEEQHSE